MTWSGTLLVVIHVAGVAIDDGGAGSEYNVVIHV